MSNIVVLKWFSGERCNDKTFIDVFFIRDNSIYCVNFHFEDKVFKQFKSSHNKSQFIQSHLDKKNYLLLADVTNHAEIDDFIKKNKLDKKIRDWKINRIIE